MIVNMERNERCVHDEKDMRETKRMIKIDINKADREQIENKHGRW